MAEKKEFIRIRGARENNLKALNVDIPRNQFVVFTGLSGSGKSSLAFDTIYAEGQRRYMESLSSYARQFLGQMEKPNVDSIEGLPPAISIDQKSTNRNPRSTVGTVTEIYDYFRLLYARIGIPHCPKCGKVISRQSVDQMVDQIMALPERTKIQLLAPVVRGRKGRHEKVLEQAKRSGYVRVMIDGSQYELSEEITLDKNLKHNISIIVDRLVVKPDIEKRLTDSVENVLDLADGLVGHLTGGLGHVNILLSVLMGGVSGSAAADASMEAKILVPEMLKRGYDEEFSAAITIASSLITPIIPPGMGLIVFSFATQISVGRMFAAGYVPGLLCMVFMMIYVYIVSKKHGYKGSRDKMASPRELLHLLRQAFWAMLIPFGILLGLRGGMFTATEAGAICAWYSLFIGVVIYKEIKWSHIWTILKESVLGTATVMILICAAGALSYFMTYERVPQALAETMLSMNLTKVSFILMTNVILLIIGMFMEGGPAQIILGPLLMPIAIQLGIDPIQFGIMFVFNLGIGNMSPPFGIVLYQVSGLMGLKFTKVAKACMPFIAIMLLVLAIIAFCPKLILFLPNLLYGA